MIKKLNDSAFLWAFDIWLAAEILVSSYIREILWVSMEQINRFSNALVLLLLAYVILHVQQYEGKQLWFIGLISLLFGLNGVYVHSLALLSTWLFVAAAQRVDFDAAIRHALCVLAVFVGMIVSLYALGRIESNDFIDFSRNRHSMGFLHPNSFGLRLMQIECCYIYLRWKNWKGWDYLLPALLCAVCYLVPNSRSAFVCGILFLFLCGIGHRKAFIKDKKWADRISAGMLLGTFLCNVGSIVLCWTDISRYDWLYSIDGKLIRRFYPAHRIWELYGVRIFGQIIDLKALNASREKGVWEYFLDNNYATILLRHGIVLYVTLFAFAVIFLRNLLREGKYLLMAFLFIFAVYGVMEQGMFFLNYNLFLLAAGPYGLYYKRSMD